MAGTREGSHEAALTRGRRASLAFAIHQSMSDALPDGRQYKPGDRFRYRVGRQKDREAVLTAEDIGAARKLVARLLAGEDPAVVLG